MKNKHLSAVLAALVSGAMLFTLAACGKTDSSSMQKSAASSQSEKKDEKKDDKKGEEKSEEKKGFEENPIGHVQEVGPLNIAMVYFQPVDMYPAGMGLPAAKANLHIETDIKAAKDNKLGYGEGDFVPGLTVNYKIVDKADPTNMQEGTFMTMNASDGPHYGANLKMDKDGDYTVTLSILSPETNGWYLHVDPETGVEGRFWTKPLTATFDWKYTVHQW